MIISVVSLSMDSSLVRPGTSDFVSADLSLSNDSSSKYEQSMGTVQTMIVDHARKWWKVDILLNAISALNSPVSLKLVPTQSNKSPIVYFTSTNAIEISRGEVINPFKFRRLLARGLVYAFDNARGNLDFHNIDHVTCTSVRAFNISGECDLWTKWLDYFGDDPLGRDMYSMKQRCIRKKVEEQIIMESVHSGDNIRTSIDKVWDRCFRDHWPFTTEPHMDTRFRDSPLRRDL